MGRHVAFVTLALLVSVGCGSSQPGAGTTTGAAGTNGSGGGNGSAGASGNGSAGASGSGSAGSNGLAGSNGSAGSAGGGASGNGAAGGNGSAGAAGGTAGHAGAGNSDAGADTHAPPPDASPMSDGPAGPSFLPAGYKGTPFAALRIPGRINACDYDRGGAGVAWCHDTGNCGAGTTTGDYPSGAAIYRPAIPATAKLCSGAACDDNVGVCRMNPQKPDKTSATMFAPSTDTYLCYSTAGEWTKYTVVVAEAGTYSIGGFMAVPQGGAMNLSFTATISTGDLTLAVTSPTNCGGGEFYHCWAQRDGLATVTFPMAGTYLMTLTQVGRFNADNFTFTKM